MPTKKTLEEINQKIEKGTAVVMTADELCNLIRDEQKITIDDIDVVTTATKGLMSGTVAILAFRVEEAAVFKSVTELYMNDVPCAVGPCPNEYLGLIDCIVYGTAHSISQPHKYGGGHLFRDLLENKEIDIRYITIEGKTVETSLRFEDVYFAKMMGIRNTFKNYLAFVNPHTEVINTIFSAQPFQGNLTQATFCGCGEINPLQKDPNHDIIGTGSPILMNGNIGYVIGKGTRSSKKKPNMMGMAGMHGMQPKYTGGFNTSMGPDSINSWAVPIPVLNDTIFQNVITIDEETEMVITDVKGRSPIESSTYAAGWQGVDLQMKFNKEICRNSANCDDCVVENECPTGAFTRKDGINRSRCFNCGTCVYLCPKAFKGNLGSIKVGSRTIPIVCRQSDRFGANKMAYELKEMIIKGEFKLSMPVAKIKY